VNKIDTQLRKISSAGQMGLMTHAVVGYPSVRDMVQIIKAMTKAGIDFIELQIPFAHPVFEGPTLRCANQDALEGGMTAEQAMHLMYCLARVVDVSLLFMTYFKVVQDYGIKRFFEDAARALVLR